MNDMHRADTRPTGWGNALGLALLLLTAGGLAGCGFAGPMDGDAAVQGGAPGAQALSITTTSLPTGQPGVPYPATTLAVVPATTSVVWTVLEGDLPAGLTLTPDGRLTGTPQGTCVATFTACAAADGTLATRTLAVSVGAFGLVALDGLTGEHAPTDTAIALACVGATGRVSLEIVANGSAGLLGEFDAEAGTATWRTGPTGDGALDRLRATDTVSGAVAEIAFRVERDPTAGYVAEFGSSDVWYVDTSRKHGTHAFASDFQALLAAAGLRSATSTSRVGTAADRLAETCARLWMLRHLNRYFLRNEDGSRGAGLPISFPWTEPVGALRPAEGGTIAGGPNRFSVISVVDGSQAGVLGTAYGDNAQNSNHENDTTGAGTGELGVFGNRFIETVNLAYNNLALLQSPLTEEDAPLLEALLLGRPTNHPRAALLRNALEGVGRSIASVAAHEIGHSLSLAHTSPYVAGSLMNSAAVFGPEAPQAFIPADLERLRVALPGRGRQTATSKLAPTVATLTLPEGGVSVCGERCNLVLAPPPCSCSHHAR